MNKRFEYVKQLHKQMKDEHSKYTNGAALYKAEYNKLLYDVLEAYVEKHPNMTKKMYDGEIIVIMGKINLPEADLLPDNRFIIEWRPGTQKTLYSISNVYYPCYVSQQHIGDLIMRAGGEIECCELGALEVLYEK